jgi:hypothetical protein
VINVKNVTDAAAVIAAFEPDIAIALTAYNVLHGIWAVQFPGKTEDDFRNYLQTSSQTNVDTTAPLLIAQGYVETPEGSGNWAKPA